MITFEEWNARIDAFIAEENKKTGRKVPVRRIFCQDDTDRSGGGIYNETVTVDTIGRFARALGDSNPLFSDPRYRPGAGAAAPFQAPPLLECCICSTFIGGKMPRLRGISVYDAGTRWERFLPILPGDSFTAETTFLGVREITKKDSASASEASVFVSPAASTAAAAAAESASAESAAAESASAESASAESAAAESASAESASAESAAAESASAASVSAASAGRLLLREHQIDLINQRGEHVSALTARSLIKCAPPDENNQRTAQKSIEKRGAEQGRFVKSEAGKEEFRQAERDRKINQTARPRYTPEELEKVYENLDAQLAGAFRRGAEPRFWEDVEVGEELPEQIVGPYDESDGQALMAAIGAANAFATKWAAIRSRKGQGITDPETGAHRHPIDRHSSDTIARAQGLPRAIVSGIHSQALLAKLVSDWMGDAGLLRSLDCKCRRPLYFGDLSFQHGRVTGRFEKDGKYYVKLELEAVRQDGVAHTTAQALVELPSRRGAPAKP